MAVRARAARSWSCPLSGEIDIGGPSMRSPNVRPKGPSITASLQLCYRLPRLQQDAHAVQRQVDVVQRVGVAEADEALAVAAEGGARQARDAGLLEQGVGQLAAAEAGAGDVREGVEGAVGFEAAHARQRIQAPHDRRAAPGE